MALSSAEAELNLALKMGCEILGMSEFCSEFGYTMKTTINGDSSSWPAEDVGRSSILR